MTEKPSAWKHLNFRKYIIAATLLPFVAQTQSLILAWQVYEIKQDPLFLGLIGLTEAIPGLSLALVSGSIVDRNNPLTVFKRMIWLGLFNALALAGIIFFASQISTDFRLIGLYSVAFFAGVYRGFRGATVTALIPQLVPRDSLHISSAWNTMGFNLATTVGPALGGLMYGWLGPVTPTILNVVLVFVAMGFIQRIDFRYSPPASHRALAGFEHLTAGLKYVLSKEILFAAMMLDMLAVFFGGVVALLPVFAAEILHVGPEGLGLLRAASAVGAVLGSLLLIKRPVRHKSGFLLLGSVAGFGLCIIGFGLSTSFWLSFTLLALGGLFDSVSMVIRSAIVQLSAPPEMRGRVGAVNSVFIGVSNQLGEFESGVLAKLLGTVPSVIVGGTMTLIVVAVTALKAPHLRRMEIQNL